MTTPTTVQAQFQLRADTAANWASVNPTLLTNELGLETDTKKLKLGDGSTAWNSLGYFPSIVSGGTVLGNLEIGTTGTLTFEGSTADGFETTLAVTDPTADRTITLPDQSGTVVVSGNASITNADIAANAEIAVSKLANGTANQVIVTDGTDVSWSDDLTLAGNLTVNGTTTTINTQDLLVEDKNIIIGNVATPSDVTADSGGITLKGTTDKTINWIDATDAWTSSERFSVPLGSAAAPSLTFTGDPNTGIYSPGADQVAISTNGTGRLLVDADGNVTVTGAVQPKLRVQSFGDYCEIKSDGNGSVILDADPDNSAANSLIRFLVDGGEKARITSTGTVNIVGAGSAGTTQAVSFNGSAPVNSVVLDSSGRLGLGTSSPVQLLEVENSSGSAAINITSSDAGYAELYFGDQSNAAASALSYEHSSEKLRLYNGGNVRVTLDSSGNVGVGTSNVSELLHVKSGSSASLDPTILIANGAPATSETASIDFGFNTQAADPDVLGRISSTITNRTTGAQASTLSFGVASAGSLSTKMTLTGTGLGVGTTSPSIPLQVLNAGTGNNTNNGAINLCRTATVGSTLYHMYSTAVSDEAFAFSVHGGTTFSDTTYTKYLASAGGVHIWYGATNATERARIDSSGRLLVGTSTAQGDYTLQIQGDAVSANAAGCIYLRRGLNTAAIGANVGADLGKIQFGANDGTVAARIQCLSDATWGSTSDTPGALVFSTNPGSPATAPVERMRITQSGFVNIGSQGTDIIWNQTSATGVTIGTAGVIQAARSNDQIMLLNRIGDDGTLVTFAQDGTSEGSISVSGTTVSYNGAHLSRWSQLPSGAERTEILRGTVLSNIDEMCEWGEEDNEQLNRMKVSDVEGDKNVAGVFQAWDDDDDTYTNDFYCAMTGDFIIRIGAGVTVERGDLLMSAGDGTAKPQDDDIIRSKTIAKVTSTNVSCTYEDGSYCVPCVLMAC